MAWTRQLAGRMATLHKDGILIGLIDRREADAIVSALNAAGAAEAAVHRLLTHTDPVTNNRGELVYFTLTEHLVAPGSTTE